MKARYIVIICLVLMSLSAGGGYALRFYTYECPKISEARPQDPEPPVYYKPLPVAVQCGIITIEGSIIAGNTFAAIAKNDCMSVIRKFDLVLPRTPARHNAISAGYAVMYDIDSRIFRHNIDVMYHYTWARASLGAGPCVQFSDQRVYQVGARIEGRILL